jgi:uncharacterized protein (TIGR02598 family)
MFVRFSIRPKMPRRKAMSDAGFSLVEVVMAVGLISFSMLGLLGLLNVGFSSAGQAADKSVQSYIIQTLNSEIQLTPAANLDKMNGVARYFDNQGNEVEMEDKPVYTATTTVQQATSKVLGTNTNPLQISIRVTSIRHPGKPKISTRLVSQ